MSIIYTLETLSIVVMNIKYVLLLKINYHCNYCCYILLQLLSNKLSKCTYGSMFDIFDISSKILIQLIKYGERFDHASENNTLYNQDISTCFIMRK